MQNYNYSLYYDGMDEWNEWNQWSEWNEWSEWVNEWNDEMRVKRIEKMFMMCMKSVIALKCPDEVLIKQQFILLPSCLCQSSWVGSKGVELTSDWTWGVVGQHEPDIARMTLDCSSRIHHYCVWLHCKEMNRNVEIVPLHSPTTYSGTIYCLLSLRSSSM